MINITDKALCTGCRVCETVCPKRCIEMKRDEEGFLYPFVDASLCINCSLCNTKCHIDSKTFTKKEFGGEIYVGFNKDENQRMKSSSGAIFPLLATEIISRGGVVYGAGFDENFKVIHKRCNDINALDELCGSKYVQSDLTDTFKSAKNDLEAGLSVLYTATPCQIGAFKTYLGKDYENLYTQSFICHGVPSPAVWEEYIKDIKDKYKKEIKTISFRDKTYGWHKFSMKITFTDGTSQTKTLDKDVFLKLFLKNTCLRPSCHNCHYKDFSTHSSSDITVADWWGMKAEILPEATDDKGASVVIVNTDKGKELFDIVSENLIFKKSDYSATIQKNPSYFESAKPSKNRQNVIGNIGKVSTHKLSKKYANTPLNVRVKNQTMKLAYNTLKTVGVLDLVKKIKK